MSHLARSAYSQAAARTASPREAERGAFERVTAMLSGAAPGREGLVAREEALYRNLKLWTLLSADLAGDGNALPDETRAALISLAGFVHAHTRKVRQGQGGVGELVDINRAIIAGLGGAAAAPAPIPIPVPVPVPMAEQRGAA